MLFRHAVALLLYPLLTSTPAPAHELPERVSVRMFAVAGADSLELMVRVPLEAMRDVDFPLTPDGDLLLPAAESALDDAATLWIVDNLRLHERGAPVAPVHTEVRAALPGDRAFASREAARAHFAAPPLAPATRIFWRQAMLDVRVVYPLHRTPAAGDLAVDVALRHLGATTRVELLFVDPSGAEHLLTFDGDASALPLMPSTWRVARNFLEDGFRHILGGLDHLLFLLCLVLPLRAPGQLLAAVTAFTVAHSITLCAAALGRVPTPLWFPSLVESVIALSILYLALENILRKRFRYRWTTAFAFGLAHGFGFAAALRDSLQFAQGQTLVALGSFNLGVELGQLVVLALLLPIAIFLFRRVDSERVTIVVVSALVAHTSWHWMTERLDVLSGYVL